METDEEYLGLERLGPGLFRFAKSRIYCALYGGIALGLSAFGIIYGDEVPQGIAKLLWFIGIWLPLPPAAWNLYVAYAGWAFVIDGKTKLVTKNGGRLASFAEVRCVDLALGYHPTIAWWMHSYALCLRLKSGESVPIAGMPWRYAVTRETYLDDLHARLAEVLDGISWEVAALMDARVSKADSGEAG